MNIRKGVRRLGIIAGLLGCAFGGLAAADVFRGLWNSRANHERFRSLVASPTIREASAYAANLTAQGHPPIVVHVGSNGIKNVYLIDDHISEIELLTGEGVQDARLASPSDYLEVLALPAIGFGVPWGTISLLSRLVLGFVDPERAADKRGHGTAS